MYEKEGIFVPANDLKHEFVVYQHPKTMDDDSEIFPNIARIPDAMLRKVDPADPILVAYLQTINPSIETCYLPKDVGSPSKERKSTTKATQASPSKPTTESTPAKGKKDGVSKPNPIPIQQEAIQPVQQQTSQSLKEVMPSKSGVLKRLMKMAHIPRHSPEHPDSSSKRICKPQHNCKGVAFNETPTPVSPTSKK